MRVTSFVVIPVAFCLNMRAERQQAPDSNRTGTDVDGTSVRNDVPPPLTRTTYNVYFRHLAHLEEAAEQNEALGDHAQAERWRTHEQRMVGLTDQATATLKRVGLDCNRAIDELDRKISEFVQAPHGLEPPPELKQLFQARDRTIDEHVDQLRTGLGPPAFERLERHIRATMQPPPKRSPTATTPKSSP